MCPYSFLLELSKTLLTPLIAIVAAYIAWQQWQTNRKKLFLDLYDRRLRIYTEVKKILSTITRDAKISTNELLIFYSSVSEADFLFGPEIPKYINEIYEHGVDLHYWNSEYRDFTQPIPKGYDHKKVCDGMHSEPLCGLHINLNQQKINLENTLRSIIVALPAYDIMFTGFGVDYANLGKAAAPDDPEY